VSEAEEKLKEVITAGSKAVKSPKPPKPEEEK